MLNKMNKNRCNYNNVSDKSIPMNYPYGESQLTFSELSDASNMIDINDFTDSNYFTDSDDTDNTDNTDSIDILSASPADVVIPEHDKLTESEIESISGIETDSESYLSTTSENYSEIERHYNSDKKYWSATDTIQQIVDLSGPMVNSDVFQVFISELIRDKCWTQEDVQGFMQIMRDITHFMNEIKNDSDIYSMLLNPKYYNIMHELLDKFDTINVMCILSTGNKCSMILNKNKKNIIKRQIQLICNLIDVYTPVFVRMILLMEKITNDLINNSEYDLNQNYLDNLSKIKSRVISSVYINRLKNKTPVEQRDILRKLSNKNMDTTSMVLPESNSDVITNTPYLNNITTIIDTTDNDNDVLDSLSISEDLANNEFGSNSIENFRNKNGNVSFWASCDYFTLLILILLIFVLLFLLFGRE